MKENLIVLFGGVSSEHDISIISALQAIKHIDVNFYNVIPVYLAKNYKWYVGKPLTDMQFYINPDYNKLKEVALVPGSNYLHYKTLFGFKPKFEVGFALPILHGVNGEDGKVMAMLNLCKIPHGVADFAESALCLDKTLFKSYLLGLGINTASCAILHDNNFKNNPEAEIDNVLQKINFPVIVKPATLGSSIGIKVCNSRAELREALVLSFSLATKALIEEFLPDITEVNVALIQDGNNLIVSELEQPIKNESILSFNNKYINKAGSMEGVSRIIPAPISEPVKTEIVQTAKYVYLSLGLKGVVRFDFIISNGVIYLNELNTIPGSLAFYLFKPVGLDYKKLINLIIKNGYNNFENLKNKTYTFSSGVLFGGADGVKK